MRRRMPSTTLSRLASIGTVAMAVAVAASLGAGAAAPGVTVVLVVAALVGAAFAALKMWCDNCFESRLVAVVVAGGTLLWQALTALVGGPMAHHVHWSLVHTALLASAGGVLLCLATDTVRRVRADGERLPYAL